ncbi:MAG: choice-of-anchor Q domain-containing protein [Ilumatobacteraceae bacterium]
MAIDDQGRSPSGPARSPTTSAARAATTPPSSGGVDAGVHRACNGAGRHQLLGRDRLHLARFEPDHRHVLRNRRPARRRRAGGRSTPRPARRQRGPTWTRMPQAASPLVDAVVPAACASAAPDQRGVERPVGSACDVGAVERDLDARVALVVPDLTSVTPSTDAIARWLGARELQVFLVDDDDSLARATAGASLIVVAGGVDAERVATQLARSALPIVVNDAPSIRAFGLGDARVIKNVSKVVVPSSTARSRSSKIRIARRPVAVPATKAASTATVFAIVNGKGNPAIAFRDDQDGRVRVALFLDEGVPELLTEDGWGVAATALESISHAA